MAFIPPLGNTSPEVLLDNATRMDKLINGPADTVPDRAGEPLDSWRLQQQKMEDTLDNFQENGGALGFGSRDELLAYTPDKPNVLAVDTSTGEQYLWTGTEWVSSEYQANEKIKTLNETIKKGDASEVIFKVVDLLGWRQFYALTSGEFGTKFTRIKPDGIELSGFNLKVSEGAGVYVQNFIGQRVTIIDENGVVAPRSLRATATGAFGTDAARLARSGIVFDGGNARIDISGPEFIKAADIIGRTKTVVDRYGNWVGGGGGMSLQDKIDILNAENLNYYSQVRSRYNTDIERLVFALTLILGTGQSIETTQEGSPALSTTVYENLGNLMLGDSPRPNSRTAANFTPVGTPELKPLKAVVQSSDGSTILTTAQISALPAGAPNEGEGAVATVNMLRTLFLRQMSLLTDPSRAFVLASCGVNGRTIEALSKGATPELYNRVREAVTRIKAIADSQGKSFGIGAILFDQG